MSQLREWMGKGLVLAAAAGLLAAPAGCIDTDPVSFVPQDTTEHNPGEQGSNDLRGELDVRLEHTVERDGAESESTDGVR
ncbi:MAG: hypothetical protein ACOCUW_04355 [Gemmatimonadota bacterium]